MHQTHLFHTCIVKALNGGSHGRLQLVHGGGLAVPWIDRLLVADQWEGEGATAQGERVAELGQVHPQVVRVEEPATCFANWEQIATVPQVHWMDSLDRAWS